MEWYVSVVYYYKMQEKKVDISAIIYVIIMITAFIVGILSNTSILSQIIQ